MESGGPSSAHTLSLASSSLEISRGTADDRLVDPTFDAGTEDLGDARRDPRYLAPVRADHVIELPRRAPHAPMGARIGRVSASASIRLFDHWPQYNRRLVEVARPMTPEQLAIRSAPDRPPIWATVAHTAAVRVYWLCGVVGEPGAETTPFPDPHGPGWEDDESVPRDAAELVTALETAWRIVEGCLDRWTPDMLADEFHNDYDGEHQVHTRGSIFQRLYSHDAYHCGELSQTLGIRGLLQIDLWRPDGGG